METSDDLQAAWKSLRLEEWARPGVYERRLAADTVHAVYAVLLRPSAQVGMALDLPSAIGAEMAEDAARGVVLRKEWRREADKVRMTLLLSEERFTDVFGVLAADILGHIRSSRTVEAGAAVLRARLEHWKRFLRAAGEEGLSAQEQIGLFGELSVMRHWITEARCDPGAVLTSWRGPSGANQDFQRANLAVEVKTSTSNDISTIRVANERQLDETGLAGLFLCHLALERRSGSGQTLPDLVAEVGGLLGEGLEASFTDSLAMAGYHKIHEGRYRAFGYSQRLCSVYRVELEFPRIKQSELRSGVSEVTYNASLTNLALDVRDLKALGELLFRSGT